MKKGLIAALAVVIAVGVVLLINQSGEESREGQTNADGDAITASDASGAEGPPKPERPSGDAVDSGDIVETADAAGGSPSGSDAAPGRIASLPQADDVATDEVPEDPIDDGGSTAEGPAAAAPPADVAAAVPPGDTDAAPSVEGPAEATAADGSPELPPTDDGVAPTPEDSADAPRADGLEADVADAGLEPGDPPDTAGAESTETGDPDIPESEAAVPEMAEFAVEPADEESPPPNDDSDAGATETADTGAPDPEITEPDIADAATQPPDEQLTEADEEAAEMADAFAEAQPPADSAGDAAPPEAAIADTPGSADAPGSTDDSDAVPMETVDAGASPEPDGIAPDGPSVPEDAGIAALDRPVGSNDDGRSGVTGAEQPPADPSDDAPPVMADTGPTGAVGPETPDGAGASGADEDRPVADEDRPVADGVAVAETPADAVGARPGEQGSEVNGTSPVAPTSDEPVGTALADPDAAAEPTPPADEATEPARAEGAPADPTTEEQALADVSYPAIPLSDGATAVHEGGSVIAEPGVDNDAAAVAVGPEPDAAIDDGTESAVADGSTEGATEPADVQSVATPSTEDDDGAGGDPVRSEVAEGDGPEMDPGTSPASPTEDAAASEVPSEATGVAEHAGGFAEAIVAMIDTGRAPGVRPDTASPEGTFDSIDPGLAALNDTIGGMIDALTRRARPDTVEDIAELALLEEALASDADTGDFTTAEATGTSTTPPAEVPALASAVLPPPPDYGADAIAPDSTDGTVATDDAITPDATGAAVSTDGTEEVGAPERAVGPGGATAQAGPSFDVIRVGGDGDMILAGKAEPLAIVVITDGDQVLGEETADIRGDWIFMPAEPLSAGNHHIGATQKLPNGTLVQSRDLILVVVPTRGTDIAGRESERADQPLVMLVPRDGGPATVVVQSPEPDMPGADGTELADAAVGEEEDRPAVILSRPSLPGAEDPGDADGPSGTADEAREAATETTEPADPGGADAERDGEVALADEGTPESPLGDDVNTGGDPAAADDTAEEPDGPVVFSSPSTPAPDEGGAADERAGADEVAAASDDRPPSEISIDIIDYDEEGDVSFAGDAPAGAVVQVYLDNAILGATEAAPSGAWQLRPVEAVAAGRHQIRVDQIAPSGDVIARIELPFIRAEPITDLPDGGFVVVQPGQSLWRIARRAYGEGIRYTEILAANKAQIMDPNMIFPGQVFIIPNG